VPATRLKSPVAQALGPVAAGLAFLAAVGLILFGIAVWASHHSGPNDSVSVNLGNNTFDAGSAKSRAQEVAQRGPILFPGLVNPDEGYIIVNHKGTDELSGWKAFAAVPAGSPITCAVQWQADAAQFKDPCTGKTYPADGAGLTQYKVSISPDQHLVIDLGRGAASATTSP
jgi:hypothetical protein